MIMKIAQNVMIVGKKTNKNKQYKSQTCESSYEETSCLLCADGYYKRKEETIKGKCYECHTSWFMNLYFL